MYHACTHPAGIDSKQPLVSNCITLVTEHSTVGQALSLPAARLRSPVLRGLAEEVPRLGQILELLLRVRLAVARPMACHVSRSSRGRVSSPGVGDVMNPHIGSYLTIPNAGIKCV